MERASAQKRSVLKARESNRVERVMYGAQVRRGRPALLNNNNRDTRIKIERMKRNETLTSCGK